jgi:hypothetical protein
MKKFFGILLLLIGLLMMGGGIAALTDANSKHGSLEGQFGETFSNRYRERANEEQMAGASGLGIGLVLFIIGIIMTASKSKKQKMTALELAAIKKIQNNNAPMHWEEKHVTATVNDDMIGKIEKLGKLKEQGLITEEEFQTQKQRILQ